MEEKNKIQQLKTMLPQIEKFYKEPRICYHQRQLIIQLAQRIDAGRPAKDIVENITGMQVYNLWELTREKGYKVIQALKEELEWMV